MFITWLSRSQSRSKDHKDPSYEIKPVNMVKLKIGRLKEGVKWCIESYNSKLGNEIKLKELLS